MEEKLVLFDLDGTLFSGNSTFDFIKYVNETNEDYLLFEKQYRYMRIYNKILFLLFKYDWYKKKSVFFLQNRSYLELKEFAEMFYDNILVQNKIDDIVALMRFYQTQNVKVGIFTATLDIVANVVAHKLGVDYIYSTPLIYDANGIATGHYGEDLLHKKSQIFHTKIEKIFKEVLFFSDNEQDIKLLNQVTLGFKIYGTH